MRWAEGDQYADAMRFRNFVGICGKVPVLRIRIRSDPVFFGYPDPDPDPGKYRIRILYPQKDPMLFKFSCYKIV